ncbi:uncharacterized protein MYCGRDRAFT_96372 [Zymoseptoria tritici IPO323]|uniref:BTB domain-containing protein n=1 Tax=Zymoseptoria tritici (strain CBS 115943 / IPO323) TaxID=336722 RepID=F9XLX0_ZYMTI|nr:uncharacterized protein MYCGRDRAFT_96372 [Zymoseptoria tritici IPO323]EGP83937.1 hypothetical protein MYCGRDRAFT_96372 [Zymoseptoria tritici IPO323]
MATNAVIAACINDPYHADVVVECGSPDARWEVDCHKAVICPQSTFLSNKCAASGDRPVETKAKDRIVIDAPYDGKAVTAVLRSMYRSKEDTEWLQGFAWIDLLRMFQVAHLFERNDLEPMICSTASLKVDEIVDLDQIEGALDEYRKLGQPYLYGHFGNDLEKLHHRQFALQKKRKEDTKRELVDTLAALRNPETRGDLSEEAYIKFLEAVQGSNWLH